MRTIFETTGKYIDFATKTLTQLCVATMTVIVTLQVIFRYFVGNPIFWAEELARYSLVWMTFLGAAVGLKAGLLASMDLLVTQIPPSLRKWSQALVIVLNISLLGFLFYYSIQLVGLPSLINQKSPAMGLPMSYVYMAMPLGLALMLLQSFVQLAEALAGERSGKR